MSRPDLHVGDYLAVVHHPHDGCQYHPGERRGALVTDAHFQQTTAAVIVGSQIAYRLCASCAARPECHRRQRQPIRAAKGA